MNYPKEKTDELMQGVNPIPVEQFTEKALQQIVRNKPIIVIPAGYHLLWGAYRLSPRLGVAFSRYLFSRMRRILDIE